MRYKKLLLMIALASTEAGCLRSDPATEMWICTRPAVSSHFTQLFGAILTRDGFSVALGRADDPKLGTTFVLEAKKSLLRVWAQNEPLNPPYEVKDIENFVGSGTDPNQFTISVGSWVPYLQSHKPAYAAIRAKLTKAHFDVRDRADDCGTGPQH